MQLDDLYQEIILDHYKSPRNFRQIPDDEAMVDEENPTCGDHIKLIAAVEDGVLSDVKIQCEGCAICTASSSMMTEKMIGLKVAEVRGWIRDFTEMMRGGPDLPEEDLDDLMALRGVKKYPLRIKCATMAWHALEDALKQLGA